MPKKSRKIDDLFDAETAFSSLSSAIPKQKRSTKDRRMLASGVINIEKLAQDHTMSVALYLRVSTSRSVESNLSIPEQQSRLSQFCEEQGWRITSVYIEAGKSAKTADRPQFKTMLHEAISEARPFQKILIWSTSRFSRSSTDYAIAERLLTQYGIEVLTIAQTFSKDATGWVAKGVATLFDQYHSDRSAEDSINARRRMVDDGYWPGGMTPDGYCLIPAPNNARRKVIVVDEDRRAIIERIHSLCLHGDGIGSPLGIKAIARWLNNRGYRTRTGARWGIQAIHRILTSTAYYGNYYWSLEPATNERRKPQPPVLLPIPSIISRPMYEQVQLLLAKRDPKMGAAKQVSSPLILSGLAKCKCGAAMTLGTGTGKQGNVYRYYVCSATNRGAQVCSSPRLPEAKLDQIVLDAVRSRVLDHRHLTDLLLKLEARERTRQIAASDELPSLQARLGSAENAIEGLLASVRIAPGLAQDPLFQRNLRSANEELACVRNRVAETIDRSAEHEGVTEGAIEGFRTMMMELLDRGQAARAKIYLSTIVERVEVGERYIRIFGIIDDLRNGVLGAIPPDNDSNGSGVRKYVRRWRRERDSNPRYGLP